MAYTTISKHTAHFNTKLYTGTGSSNAITGVGFQPDLVWIKNRATTGNHALFNVISGVTKYINSNTNYSEQTSAPTLTAFGTDGFTVGSSSDLNGNGNNIVSWNWKAGGAGSANTDGDINSTVSVNTTAGFSIVKYTGNGSSNQSIGHGLGVRPKMIIIKNLDTAGAWMVWHDSLTSGSGTQKFLQLDNNNAQNNGSAGDFPYEPTTSVFKVGSYDTMNKSGDDIIAYCFTPITGFSSFGKFIGNGSTDGPFIYTGFKPSFVIAKESSSTGHWRMRDNKRMTTGNPIDKLLRPDQSNAEQTEDNVDFLSNGFKMRTTGGENNGSGDTYIYMAFGQSLVGSNNVPCTAR